MGNYEIYYGCNDVSEEERVRESQQIDSENKAWVASIINKGICIIDDRMMDIRIKTGDSINDRSVLNSYDPHNVYRREVILKYWELSNLI